MKNCQLEIKTLYLNSFTVGTFVSFIFTVFLSFSPFMHRYLVSDLLTFIPLLFNTYLQHSSLFSTSSLVSLQITISSANSIVYGSSLLTLFFSLSIITSNRNGLNADPWCSLTLTLKLFASSYCTPDQCFASLIHISYKLHILFCHS